MPYIGETGIDSTTEGELLQEWVKHLRNRLSFFYDSSNPVVQQISPKFLSEHMRAYEQEIAAHRSRRYRKYVCRSSNGKGNFFSKRSNRNPIRGRGIDFVRPIGGVRRVQ